MSFIHIAKTLGSAFWYDFSYQLYFNMTEDTMGGGISLGTKKINLHR